jgi:hypothetical protein
MYKMRLRPEKPVSTDWEVSGADGQWSHAFWWLTRFGRNYFVAHSSLQASQCSQFR